MAAPESSISRRYPCIPNLTNADRKQLKEAVAELRKAIASSGQQTSNLGSELVRGLRQAEAHFRGESTLRTYEYKIPEHIDVGSVRKRQGSQEPSLPRGTP